MDGSCRLGKEKGGRAGRYDSNWTLCSQGVEEKRVGGLVSCFRHSHREVHGKGGRNRQSGDRTSIEINQIRTFLGWTRIYPGEDQGGGERWKMWETRKKRGQKRTEIFRTKVWYGEVTSEPI